MAKIAPKLWPNLCNYTHILWEGEKTLFFKGERSNIPTNYDKSIIYVICVNFGSSTSFF